MRSHSKTHVKQVGESSPSKFAFEKVTQVSVWRISGIGQRN